MNAHVVLAAMAGGLFGGFTFVHFVVDWVFQTHDEAMAKHNNAVVRARHCAIYTLPFIPLMAWLGFELWELIVGALTLFVSHFVEDTYLPVYVWAKWIRRPPEMRPETKYRLLRNELETVDKYLSEINDNTSVERFGLEVRRKELQEEIRNFGEFDAKPGFIKFVDSALGKILMITIDQLVHLSFLWVLVYFALN
jgi:hypothetical protein